MHVFINILVISSLMKYSISDSGGKTAVKICSCYAFYGTKTSDVLSWTESRQRCNSIGGDLVSMETREEWKFIRDEIQSRWAFPRDKKGLTNEWHIGLVKLDGTWTWVSGKRLENTKMGQWPWQPGEPNNEHGEEDVAVVTKNYPKDRRGLFNDIRRNGIMRGFICERVEDSCKDDYSEQWCRTRIQLKTSARPKTSTKSTNVTTSKSDGRSTATAIISTKAPKIIGKSSVKDHNIKTTGQTPPTSNETTIRSTDTRSQQNSLDATAVKCIDVIVVIIPFICVTSLLLAVIVFLWLRMRRSSRVCQKCNDVIEMKRVRRGDENTNKNTAGGSGPALYQDLGETRSESAHERYTPLCEANRERTVASAAAAATDRLLSAPEYENVELANKTDYEIY